MIHFKNITLGGNVAFSDKHSDYLNYYVYKRKEGHIGAPFPAATAAQKGSGNKNQPRLLQALCWYIIWLTSLLTVLVVTLSSGAQGMHKGEYEASSTTAF